MLHAQGGAGGGFPFNMQSIFEQIFRDDPQYGAFFRGEAIVETTIQLSFMVRHSGLYLQLMFLCCSVCRLKCMRGWPRTAMCRGQITKQQLTAPDPPCSRPQEAARGTTKRISLAGIDGVSNSPIDVDIPAGVDSGQTIQVRQLEPF